MTRTDEKRGPFCSAHGCVEQAVAGISLAYNPRVVFLCDQHMQPIRGQVARMLHPPVQVPDPVLQRLATGHA